MWIIAIAVGTLVVALLVAELIARSAMSQRLATGISDRDGLEVSLGPTPALIQVASGSVDLQVDIDDSALQSIVSCAGGIDDAQARSTVHGIEVTIERAVRGFTIPVTVLLTPEQTEDGWTLRADSLSAAGIALPPERAAAMLGEGSAAALLREGVTLDRFGPLKISGVSTRDGLLTLTAATKTNGVKPHITDDPGAFARCLTPSSQGEQE